MMEFDTILTEEELKDNILGILENNKGVFKNLITFSFGDISKDLKMDGYINGNNFHLVSYLSHYKKNVEINGAIINLGNIRKVIFSINWQKKFDIIIYFSFIGFILSFLIGSIYRIHLLIMVFIFICFLIVVINIIIILNKKIVNYLERIIFKKIIKSKYIE